MSVELDMTLDSQYGYLKEYLFLSECLQSKALD